MKRYALITPKPESAARGTLVRPAPTQGAAGLGEGSRKVQPAATKAASKVQPAATKPEKLNLGNAQGCKRCSRRSPFKKRRKAEKDVQSEAAAEDARGEAAAAVDEMQS